MRKAFSFLLKAAVSGLLLYVALRGVNIRAVGSRFSQIDPGWISAAVLAVFVQQFLLAERWREIMMHCGSVFRFGQLLRITIIGCFFNQTLPSSVGGDAMRIWLASRGGAGGWRPIRWCSTVASD